MAAAQRFRNIRRTRNSHKHSKSFLYFLSPLWLWNLPQLLGFIFKMGTGGVCWGGGANSPDGSRRKVVLQNHKKRAEQDILSRQQDSHLLLCHTEENERKHKPRRGKRKTVHCLTTLLVLNMAVSGFFQVLFSSSVIFCASCAYFTMHKHWKQTIKPALTARNSTNDSTIPKAQGLEKYQLRIKIRRRKKIYKEVN